jgi:hypothetical protein
VGRKVNYFSKKRDGKWVYTFDAIVGNEMCRHVEVHDIDGGTSPRWV